MFHNSGDAKQTPHYLTVSSIFANHKWKWHFLKGFQPITRSKLEKMRWMTNLSRGEANSWVSSNKALSVKALAMFDQLQWNIFENCFSLYWSNVLRLISLALGQWCMFSIRNMNRQTCTKEPKLLMVQESIYYLRIFGHMLHSTYHSWPSLKYQNRIRQAATAPKTFNKLKLEGWYLKHINQLKSLPIFN